jgi:hypothetical protein
MAESKKKVEAVEEKAVNQDFIVEDPQLLRPVELPLVVKPLNGKEWATKAQAEFARTLNGYAYKNPEKWAVKKDALLKELKALELVKDRPEDANAPRLSFGKRA